MRVSVARLNKVNKIQLEIWISAIDWHSSNELCDCTNKLRLHSNRELILVESAKVHLTCAKGMPVSR